MTTNQKIFELRLVFRSGDEQDYPFSIHTGSRFLFPTFAEAERMKDELVSLKAEVYYYGIYALPLQTQLVDDSEATDVFIYLPDGSLWARSGMRNDKIRKGDICEHISGTNVFHCLIEDEAHGEGICSWLSLGDNTIGWGKYTQVIPCTLPIKDGYAKAIRSKLERYEEVQNEALLPVIGLPYPAESIYEENMEDYLYVPSSFSGFCYDMFFDCNAAYRTHMHPLWLFIAYPDGGRTVLLPVTVSVDPVMMWDEYEHAMRDMWVDDGLIKFITHNMYNIMALADGQFPPEDFLWNMVKLDHIDSMLVDDLHLEPF